MVRKIKGVSEMAIIFKERGIRKQNKRLVAFICLLFFLFVSAFSFAESDQNAITLIDQPDRQIEIKDEKIPSVKKGISLVTGKQSKVSYQPVLVEFNNENGGIYATAPKGITKASVIYEYQMLTNGTMGISAIFQDDLVPAGPVGNASVGGLLIQNDWNCGYVYQAIPTNADGSVSELGYSIQNWIDSYSLVFKRVLFPGDASKTKEWKKYFKMDPEMLSDENQTVKTEGIHEILEKNNHEASKPMFVFMTDKEIDNYEGDIPVREIDIRMSSRAFSSGFVYDDNSKEYYRWIGENNQYGDVDADEQLHVSNLIIQRVSYTTANKMMAPNTIGRGNADIFLLGSYIEGYWVRDSLDEHTRYYDSEGNLIHLVPGSTYIALLSNTTSVVILNYEIAPVEMEVYE